MEFELTHLSRELKKAIALYEKYISCAQDIIANSPKGSLRFVKRGRKWQYFIRTSSAGSGIYLSESDLPLITAYADKSYSKLVNRFLPSVLQLMKMLDAAFSDDMMDKLFLSLPDPKRLLVTPYVPTKEEQIKQWTLQVFPPNSFHAEYLRCPTLRGEYVRSKAEAVIADALYQHEIPYFYEPLLVLGGVSYRPDFLVLNTRTMTEYYWEHFGRMDDPEYVQKNLEKLRVYSLNKVPLIRSYEAKNEPLTAKPVEELICAYLL